MGEIENDVIVKENIKFVGEISSSSPSINPEEIEWKKVTFLNCYLPASRPTLGYSLGENLMLTRC